MDYIQNLKLASQYITIIVGCSLCLFGITGAIANLFIFSRPRFLKTACGQYILVGSFIDLIFLGFILSSRIFTDGFQMPTYFAFDWICKIRNYLGTMLLLASTSCKCLAAFDRWASTSQQIHIQQWSHVHRARILLFITITFFSLLALPNAILGQSINYGGIWTCISLNRIYRDYYAYFLNPFLVFLFPVLILTFFGCRTRVHITRLVHIRRIHSFERQLNKMILYQILFIVISSVPYGVQFFYTTLTLTWNKTALWLAIDSVIVQIGRMFIFVNSASAFYIYVIMSKSIRSSIKNWLRKLVFHNQQENRVLPVNRNKNYQMHNIRS